MALIVKRKLTTTLAFHADANNSITLTNMPLAETMLLASARTVHLMDLTSYNEVRLTAKVSTVGSAGSEIRAKFGPTTEFSTTVANYDELGLDDAEVAADITALGLADSGWIKLNNNAKDEVSLCIVTQGGDGAADPVLDNITLHFRTKERYI